MILFLEALLFLVVTFFVFALFSFGFLGFAGIVKWAIYEESVWFPEEDSFVAVDEGSAAEPVDSLFSPSSRQLSVIVPAYNEEARLPSMLEECLDYLSKRRRFNPRFTYEVIVVDDGSADRTVEVALAIARERGERDVRVLKLLRNCGKGGAVRRGMMVARGTYLLMADADGATFFPDFEKLEGRLQAAEVDALGMVVGSRAHLVQEDTVAQRSALRNFLMKGFHVLTWLLCEREVQDTQCGFKLFTRETARLLFPRLNVERWAFDLELLYLARAFAIPVVEVGVKWTEVDGSKLNPMAASVQMLRDMIRIRFLYMVGWWKADSKVVQHYEKFFKKKK